MLAMFSLREVVDCGSRAMARALARSAAAVAVCSERATAAAAEVASAASPSDMPVRMMDSDFGPAE